MFDIELPEPAIVATLDDAGLLDAVAATSKLESAIQARRFSAIGELWERRKRAAAPEHEYFLIDTWEEVAAEIAAAVGVTSWRAAGLMRIAEALRERLPKVAAVFGDGDIDLRIVSMIVYRTELIEDAGMMANVDGALARRARRWAKLSRPKIAQLVDGWVERFDPEGVRAPRKYEESRYLEIDETGAGMAGIWGNVHAPDAAALDKRLDQLAATVCPNDPRTQAQRRADAVRALAGRKARMQCMCGSPDCAGEPVKPSGDVVIHVLAESATVEGNNDNPGYVPGFGPLPADALRELAKSARLKPLIVPKDAPPEKGYRPSVALADFVRFRDLTCRFPGCDCPAEFCDIDHTIPYDVSRLTHPSNLKCVCRKHHLLKTFWNGEHGWRDRQLPDGTVIWTAPTGQRYTTYPASLHLFPSLCEPTATLWTGDAPVAELSGERGVMMPRRRHTRAHTAAKAIAAERRLNDPYVAERNKPPPF